MFIMTSQIGFAKTSYNDKMNLLWHGLLTVAWFGLFWLFTQGIEETPQHLVCLPHHLISIIMVLNSFLWHKLANSHPQELVFLVKLLGLQPMIHDRNYQYKSHVVVANLQVQVCVLGPMSMFYVTIYIMMH